MRLVLRPCTESFVYLAILGVTRRAISLCFSHSAHYVEDFFEYSLFLAFVDRLIVGTSGRIVI